MKFLSTLIVYVFYIMIVVGGMLSSAYLVPEVQTITLGFTLAVSGLFIANCTVAYLTLIKVFQVAPAWVRAVILLFSPFCLLYFVALAPMLGTQAMAVGLIVLISFYASITISAHYKDIIVSLSADVYLSADSKLLEDLADICQGLSSIAAYEFIINEFNKGPKDPVSIFGIIRAFVKFISWGLLIFMPLLGFIKVLIFLRDLLCRYPSLAWIVSTLECVFKFRWRNLLSALAFIITIISRSVMLILALGFVGGGYWLVSSFCEHYAYMAFLGGYRMLLLPIAGVWGAGMWLLSFISEQGLEEWSLHYNPFVLFGEDSVVHKRFHLSIKFIKKGITFISKAPKNWRKAIDYMKKSVNKNSKLSR